MDYKISVIVPIYNAEMHLKKCINSILNQTFEEFELLLINDGSTDNSRKICDYYNNYDSRVKVIHKENSGSAHSRNLGISEAKGEYICFIDSDDWIDENMLSDTLELAQKYKSDIVISGICFNTVDINGNILNSIVNNNEFSIWDNKEKLRRNIIKLFPNALINSSCNKLYKKNILLDNNIKFINTNVGEDTSFNLDVIKYSNNIIVTDKVYYHYMRYQNIKTLTNRLHDNAFKRYLEIHQNMIELFVYFGEMNEYIENEINKTMFSQYIATSLKILNADNKVYPYKIKKRMLDEGIMNRTIINTFYSTECFSIKEKVLRFLIKKRLYFIITILLRIKG